MDPSGIFGIQHRAQRLEGPVIETPTADLLISAFSTSLCTAILCQVFSAVQELNIVLYSQISSMIKSVVSNNAAAVESLEREEENESNNKSVKQASLVLLFIML